MTGTDILAVIGGCWFMYQLLKLAIEILKYFRVIKLGGDQGERQMCRL